MTAAYAYDFPVDRLVQRLKFGGDLALGAWLGERLADRVRSQSRPDLLVATPLSAQRLRERGFNQALELARIVGRQLRVPVARGLTRGRHSHAQAGLGRKQRRGVERDFRIDRTLTGLDVALVDDVLTTGATAESLAALLRAAGARSVRLWVAARTPEPGSG